MSCKTILVLFVVFSLLTSVGVGTTFADTDDDKKKKTFEQMCAKKKGNSPDALFCQAILGLQQSTNSFFDIFTELRLVDTSLQNQINSFFDVFVELDDVADKQCPSGTFASGTNLDGSLICTDITQNQDCDDGFYMSGIDDDGKIKCKPLPSNSNLFCGDSIVTDPETCDDGNFVNGDGCSVVCSIETTDLCLGVDVDDGNECTTDTCSVGVVIHTDNGFCTEVVCSDGLVSGTEQCDDGDFNPGDGCDATCQVETGFSCVGSPSVCSAVCGDGIMTGAEQCDGSDLGGLSCIDFGYDAGVLRCTSSCTIDETICRFVDTCPGGPPCP